MMGRHRYRRTPVLDFTLAAILAVCALEPGRATAQVMIAEIIDAAGAGRGLPPLCCGDTGITQNSNVADTGTVIVHCTQSGVAITAETAWARCFGGTDFPTDFALQCVEFGVAGSTSPTDQDFDVDLRISALSPGCPPAGIIFGDPAAGQTWHDAPAAFTVLHLQTVTIRDGSSGRLQFFLEPPVVIPAGTDILFELHAPSRFMSDGGDSGVFSLGGNLSGAVGETFIWASTCGINSYTALPDIDASFTEQWVLRLNGTFGPIVPPAVDCNANGVPDECETDCNANGLPDECDVDPLDPDGNGLVSPDCNANGIPDECDIADGITTLASAPPFSRLTGVTQDASTGDFIVTGIGTLFRFTAGGAVTTIASGPPFSFPVGVTQDASTGDFIVADFGNGTLFRVTAGGVVTTIASGSQLSPFDVTQDASTGDFIVTGNGNNKLFRVTAGGAVTTIASGAPFSGPSGVTQDASTGDFFITDVGGLPKLFRVTAGGVVTTIASGSPFSNPFHVTQDASTGDLVVADGGNGTLFRVTAAGVVTTIASGPPFSNPFGVTQDASTGDFIVTDDFNSKLFRIRPPTSPDCNANGVPDICEGSDDVALFVGEVIAAVSNPLLTCLFDRNGDGTVNGLDIQGFVDGLLAGP